MTRANGHMLVVTGGEFSYYCLTMVSDQSVHSRRLEEAVPKGKTKDTQRHVQRHFGGFFIFMLMFTIMKTVDNNGSFFILYITKEIQMGKWNF